MNWQEEVAREMIRWGFQRGNDNPCLYYDERRRLMALVHGDAFVTVGDAKAAHDFKRQLQSRFEIKTEVIGSRSKVSLTRVEAGASETSRTVSPKKAGS